MILQLVYRTPLYRSVEVFIGRNFPSGKRCDEKTEISAACGMLRGHGWNGSPMPVYKCEVIKSDGGYSHGKTYSVYEGRINVFRYWWRHTIHWVGWKLYYL